MMVAVVVVVRMMMMMMIIKIIKIGIVKEKGYRQRTRRTPVTKKAETDYQVTGSALLPTYVWLACIISLTRTKFKDVTAE